MECCGNCVFIQRKPGRTRFSARFEGRNMHRVEVEIKSTEGYCTNKESEHYERKVFDTFKYAQMDIGKCEKHCKGDVYYTRKNY